MFANKNRDHRRVKKHTSTCYVADTPSIGANSESDNDVSEADCGENAEPSADTESMVNDDDNAGAIFFYDAQSDHESWPDPESVERETSSLTGHEFPNFGTDNKTTNKYFEQEFEMFHKHGIEFGGTVVPTGDQGPG